jgi:hypothetical protein
MRDAKQSAKAAPQRMETNVPNDSDPSSPPGIVGTALCAVLAALTLGAMSSDAVRQAGRPGQAFEPAICRQRPSVALMPAAKRVQIRNEASRPATTKIVDAFSKSGAR